MRFDGNLADRIERYMARFTELPGPMHLVLGLLQVSDGALEWAFWASMAAGDADAVDILERLLELPLDAREHAAGEDWEVCEAGDFP